MNIIKVTEQHYARAVDEQLGWCLACNSEQDGVEPDAERYTCHACGERQVFGAEQLMLSGQVEFIEVPTIPADEWDAALRRIDGLPPEEDSDE